MAKEKNDKLTLVPGNQMTGIMALIATTETAKLPDTSKFEKLTLPPMIKPKYLPVGAAVSGKLVRFVKNFSGRESLRGTKLFHLNNNGTEFLFPVSRSMRSAVSVIECDDDKPTDSGLKKSYEGKTLWITRLADGGNKNHPENPMLNFDIRVEA